MTTTQEVTQAEQEAADAAAAVQGAEAQIASGGRGVTAATLHRIRDRYRHSVLSAEGARSRAEQERQAGRLAGLETIATAADELARRATGPTTLHEALQALATAGETIRAHAAAHDAELAELIAAASDLGAEPVAPGGPRPSSAHVAVTRTDIWHGDTLVTPLGTKTEEIIRLAAAGEVDEATALVNSAVQHRPVHRSAHYVRGSGGQVIGMDELNAQVIIGLRSGELVELTAPQVEAYLAGAEA